MPNNEKPLRIHFENFQSTGKFPDGRAILDVWFKDSYGRSYHWTPRWDDTRAFFVEASKIEGLNVPGGTQEQEFREVAGQVASTVSASRPINFRVVATRLGQMFINLTTLNEIGRAAGALFDFPKGEHENAALTSSRAQLIYEWVMALGEQAGLTMGEKRRLLRDFIEWLAGDQASAVQTIDHLDLADEPRGV